MAESEPKMILPQVIGDFDVQRVNYDRYKLTLRDTKYIEQTGAKVSTYLDLPVAHHLETVILKHTDSSDVDCTDALTYAVKKRLLIGKNLYVTLRSGSAVAASDIVETFGDKYSIPLTRYLIETDTTNTDRIYPTITVRVI